MNRYGLLCIILFMILPGGFSVADNPGRLPAYLQAYRQAERLYRDENTSDEKDSLALSGYLRVIGLLEGSHINDSVLWDSYYKAAIFRQTFGDYDKALPLLKKCLSFPRPGGPVEEAAYYLPNIYAGNSYYVLNRFDSARYYFREAEAIAAKHPDIPGLERLYNTLGVINYETGNYVQSGFYFEKALSTLGKVSAEERPLEVTYKNNLASVYSKQERFDEAMTLYRSLLPYDINRDELLHNIGTIYLRKGENRRAITNFRSISASDQNTMNDMALAYLNLDKQDSALYYLRQAFVVNDAGNHGRKSISLGVTYKLHGDLLARQSKWDDALSAYQRGLMQMVYLFNDSNIYQSPKKFEGVFAFEELFDLLLAKGQAFQSKFHQGGHLRDLEAAKDVYEEAYRLADYVEKSYETDEARLFLNRTKYLSHSKPIDVCMHLFRITGKKTFLESAFYFDEKNKASALSINLQESRLKPQSGIPKALLERENDLRQSIARLSLKAAEANEPASQQLQALVRDQNLQLTALQQEFDRYPAYKRLKYADNTITGASLQKMLSANTVVISYHLGDTSLTVFLVTKDRFEGLTLPKQDSLIPKITVLQSRMQETEGTDFRKSNMQRRYLYNQLLKPLEAFLESAEQLVVIPDDELSLIPFETLAGEDHRLVIEKYAVSYNYSCSMLQVSDDERISMPYSLFAMAPFDGSTAVTGVARDQLSLLPASAEEVGGLKGKILLGKEATRTAFLQQAPAYGIIHLATHGSADDENPGRSSISFYPLQPDSPFTFKLFIPEIYNLKLKKTRLVVLSACETGDGRLVKGEGVMSLSRAFSYAGCPKIITSLWKADDRATAFIAKRLHYYLQKTFSVARALQLAKLDYLDSDTIAARVKIPAYWAHLRLIGNLEADQSSAPLLMYFAAAICIGVIIFLLIRRTRMRS